MTPERYRVIKEIVGAAIDCQPSEREGLLVKACHDDRPLRLEVDKLLERERPALSFMEESPFDGFPSLSEDDEPSLAGQLIGPYRIVKEIGRGGMGAVYLASREDGQHQRNVAIKLIKRGMDTDSILRRFRNEQQILANLNHPNIAGLYSGGTTEDGLPYFVMEYVEGVAIDQYCEAHRLSTEERLKLFRPICAAVQYAHQNLVIHRDIKPGNLVPMCVLFAR